MKKPNCKIRLHHIYQDDEYVACVNCKTPCGEQIGCAVCKMAGAVFFSKKYDAFLCSGCYYRLESEV